ncbi:acetate--CoA ligase family protein [Nocardia sp. NPDC004604]|uniref:acetate--CoA ligase family protein n=1 Tax=Nocardia sp. NPDC004604 TaxID=3157013 RepID=UPI0033A1FDC1
MTVTTTGPDLDRFLRPASIAIVGASEAAGGYPAKVLGNLRRFGFRGEIYPVNPRRETVFDLPCYPSLSDTPTVPDLALVLVPASAAEAVIAEAASLGVRAAVVFSSGFAEMGAGGLAAQQRIADIASEGGLLLLGPNSQGYFHQPGDVVASFSTVLDDGLAEGASIAYVGQSGALGGAVLGFARERGIGIASWFSTGNEAGLSATDAARRLLDNPSISTVIVHLEAVPDGRAWTALAEAVRFSGKRVVCLRSGRSSAGQRAAASHTGAMVRDDEAFVRTAAAAGIVVVDDIDAALDLVEALSAPVVAGRRVGIITTSGGAGGLASDHLAKYDIDVPVLSEATRERLAAVVPAYGAVANPVDVTAQLFTGDLARFGAVAATVAADDEIDAVLIVVTNLSGETARVVAEGIVREMAGTTKPCQIAWLAPAARVSAAREVLEAAGIRVYHSVPDAVRPLHRRLHVPAARTGGLVPLDARPRTAVWQELADLSVVTEHRGRHLLEAAGIAVPASVLVTGKADLELARQMTPPYVVKIQSPDVLHKTDVGGVRLGVTRAGLAESVDEVRAAVAAQVPDATVEGVLVQEMADVGVDLIVAVRAGDDGYRPVVTVGAGGVATELFGDIASALAPIEAADVVALLRKLRSWPLLDGFRGATPADVDGLATAISELTWLAAQDPALREIEINPLRVGPNGVTALDLVCLRSAQANEPTTH